VDVAWDYQCLAGDTPERWVDMVAPHARSCGLTLGGTGQGDVWTRYVGAPESSRRIRVYRKDLRDEGWLFQFGSTLRVELVMRHEVAKAWWKVFDRDEVEGMRVAAGHINEMVGLPVQAEWSEVPRPGVEPVVDAAQMVFEFLKQNEVMLIVCDTLGINLGQLANERHSSLKRRESECRLRQRLAVLGEVPSSEVVECVRAMIRKG